MTEIVRKTIMQPTSPSTVPVVSTLVIGGLYALTMLVMMSWETQIKYILAVPATFAAWVLFSAFRQGYRLKSTKKAIAALKPVARKAMIGFIGSEPKYLDASGTVMADWNPVRLSGTGIAIKDDLLYVMQDGEIAQIPWGLIRSWEWRIEGTSSARLIKQGVPAGVAAAIQLQANEANADASAAAYRDSGLFITVADIDRPIWQFRTVDEKTLRRWDEILRQVKEGRLVSA